MQTKKRQDFELQNTQKQVLITILQLYNVTSEEEV